MFVRRKTKVTEYNENKVIKLSKHSIGKNTLIFTSKALLGSLKVENSDFFCLKHSFVRRADSWLLFTSLLLVSNLVAMNCNNLI